MTLSPEQREALDLLIKHEWPGLERFFRTKVRPGDVADVAQATCLAFVEQLDQARAEPRRYLWGIARLQVLKHWEKFRRADSEPFDSSRHSLTDVGPSLSSTLDRRNRLHGALQELPADLQFAIELRHVQGLRLEEVADALGVSLATAKRHITSAEKSLRKTLGEDPVVALRRESAA